MKSNCRMCVCASGTYLPSQKATFCTGRHLRRTGEKSVSAVMRPCTLPGLRLGGAVVLRCARRAPSSRATPDLPPLGRAAGVPRDGEAVVVLDLEVRELHPDAGHGERVDVRREAAVRLDEVPADLLRVLDRLRRVPAVARLLEVRGGFAAVAVDL